MKDEKRRTELSQHLWQLKAKKRTSLPKQIKLYTNLTLPIIGHLFAGFYLFTPAILVPTCRKTNSQPVAYIYGSSKNTFVVQLIV